MSEKKKALSEKSKLLLKIQQLSFALVEANLYLDTHPTCEHGIAYFRKHREELEKVKEEYKKLYGPLTAASSVRDDDSKKWDWVTTPFPWENERSES